jgi:hypothetical protein
MKTKWTLGIAAITIGLSAAGLYAQSSDSRKEPSSITVTGCLQSAGAATGAVGTSGTTGSASAQASKGPFMLVNARVGNAPGGGSGVTSVAPPGSGTNQSAVRAGSTSPSPALSGAIDKNGEPTKAGEMFALRGDMTELPHHVNQEVEISGRLNPSGTAASGSSSATTSSARSASGTAGAAAGSGMQELEVQTLRMIASSCVTQ